MSLGLRWRHWVPGRRPRCSPLPAFGGLAALKTPRSAWPAPGRGNRSRVPAWPLPGASPAPLPKRWARVHSCPTESRGLSSEYLSGSGSGGAAPTSHCFSLSQHQGLFQRVSSSHQVAKDWSFSITSPNEFDLLAVQGTLKSLLQYHTLKAVLQRSAFFMIQLSASIRDYWKNHTLLQLKVDALGQPWESEDVLRELDIFCVVIN
ncbi:protein yippee-like 2 isoform X1 [Bos indicus]|uniref:Protein yippee-like 2 isoform X1 n=1 Tax=Bos indicus TaxID=9915 RepID=A0ABM4QZG2_BOSIN